jgi:hypothetical protein
MEWLGGLLVFLALALVGFSVWIVGRRALQFCPHCGWIVRRVQTGWRRCPRCRRQYGRGLKVRP